MRGKLAGGCAVIGIFFIACIANADNQKYLCIGKQSVGFNDDSKTGKWQEASFFPGKYIIFPHTLSQEEAFGALIDPGVAVYYNYEVKMLSTNLAGYCQSSIAIGYMSCDKGTLSPFAFNLATMRFENFILGGYAQGTPKEENTDTPEIEIGTCRIFNK